MTSRGPIFSLLEQRIGERRLMEFMEGHARVQAMAVFLVLTTGTVPSAGYSDDALQAMRDDAQDLRLAADDWARVIEEVADEWKAQREAAEK